tara:strand:- start:559 stop:786 length:228 start_codon:yes stop_codon:yes gene_type:complete
LEVENMMKAIKDVCSRTETPNGQIVVGASVLLLGLAHFGKDSGLMNFSVGPVSVGTVAGTVGVVVGSCILINRFM